MLQIQGNHTSHLDCNYPTVHIKSSNVEEPDQGCCFLFPYFFVVEIDPYSLLGF